MQSRCLSGAACLSMEGVSDFVCDVMRERLRPSIVNMLIIATARIWLEASAVSLLDFPLTIGGNRAIDC
jgi:hypothetical protein